MRTVSTVSNLGCTMVTVYSGYNFTGDARCLRYHRNETGDGCKAGYYSFLAGILKGFSQVT